MTLRRQPKQSFVRWAAALEVRVTALEASENQRKGAVKLTEWAIRVVPFAALGAGFAVAAEVVGL